MLEDTKKE